MLPNAAAAWYMPAAGVFCAFWWWWPKGMASRRIDSNALSTKEASVKVRRHVGRNQER
jgi:hypothetical protein